MLECADESYYVGMTTSLEKRLAEHEAGIDPYAYTYSRRPVTLVWNQAFDTEHEAFTAERQLKGWSRAKKQALSKGDWNAIEGAYFDEWSQDHVIDPFVIPSHWLKFLSGDWGSARPFSFGWWGEEYD